MSSTPPASRRALPRGQDARANDAEWSRYLLRVQEEERKRISRELHDGTGQGLMALRLCLGTLAGDRRAPQPQPKIQEALKLLDLTIEDLRRIIGRLSPRTLDELGLLAAIRKEARELSRNTGIKAQLDLPKSLSELDYEHEVAIYRSLQEALHNIAKHSGARTFKVGLENDSDSICLRIEDDGVGFSGKRTSPNGSFGLLGMKERVAALGGKVRIRSRKGSGTQIRVILPGPSEGGKQAVTELRLPLLKLKRAVPA